MKTKEQIYTNNLEKMVSYKHSPFVDILGKETYEKLEFGYYKTNLLIELLARELFREIYPEIKYSKICLDVGSGINSAIKKELSNYCDACFTLDKNDDQMIYSFRDITSPKLKYNSHIIGDYFYINEKDSILKNETIDLFVFWGSVYSDGNNYTLEYFNNYVYNEKIKDLSKRIIDVGKENNPNAKFIIVSSRFALFGEGYENINEERKKMLSFTYYCKHNKLFYVNLKNKVFIDALFCE